MNLEIFQHQWIPVARIKEISSRPSRYIVLGEPVVLYRLNHDIIALQDKCPHRGMPLSEGKIKEGLLQCPYHGWRFNAAGECVKVPGLIGDTCLKDKSVPSYLTKSYQGILFICINIHESTLPLYEIPALLSDRYRTHVMQFKVDGDILNIIENTLDATHTHFVHGGLLRLDNNRQRITATLSVNEQSAEVRYENEKKQSGIVSAFFEKDRQMSIGRFRFPLIAELEYYGKEQLTAAFTFYLNPSPSGKNHQVFLVISYRYHGLTSWLKKTLFLPMVKMAFKQDKKILKKQSENIEAFKEVSFKSTELDLLRAHIVRILAHQSKDYQKMITLEV